MSANKRRGTAWESQIVAALQARGWPNAERRALNGANDRGDIAGVVGWCIEAKSAAGLRLAEWSKELAVEVLNAKARHGALWIKRRGKASACDGYVVLDGSTFLTLLEEAGYR